jgi:hypothetical protein
MNTSASSYFIYSDLGSAAFLALGLTAANLGAVAGL